MDNPESTQLQVLANDLYIIHEKIIKTDTLIKIVKEKSKRCNKLEKLHKKLLDSHNQLQLKQSDSDIKLNNCFVNHGPLEIELKELKNRLEVAEAEHRHYVNVNEIKYQTACRDLEKLKEIELKQQTRYKKNNRTTKDELLNKVDDLTIELELTKSELESLNKDLIKKDKIINKYEYEKQLLNDKIDSLNNRLNIKAVDNIHNDVPLIDDFVTDVLPAISELDNTLPILSDSICADIIESDEREFVSFGVQTDVLFPSNNNNKNIGIQTNLEETKTLQSFACQTSIATNCIQLQTDDELWVKHVENMRKMNTKTMSSQTYYDDILNVEDILQEMIMTTKLLSPLSPDSPLNNFINDELDINKSNNIAVGPDEIIPTFSDIYCQTDKKEQINSHTQTESNKTQQIDVDNKNTQTETNLKIDQTSQTEIFTLNKLLSSNVNVKTPQRCWETKLKNRLNTPNSKICKKYKTTKNKLLEHLKLSNLDFKQILEKYLSEGNGPTLFVSPKILKSSHLNPCKQQQKQQNPFLNISNQPLFQQCHSTVHECPCYHIPRNYPSCTTLQCNISCNPGYAGYCNHSHRIKIKHNSNAVIVSSDSETDEYNIRNYYKNKFRNKYKTKYNCNKCTKVSNENFYNKLHSMKIERKTSDTDTSTNIIKLRKRRRILVTSSSDDDSDDSSYRDRHKRHKFKNPVNQIAQEKLNNNLVKAAEKENNINSKICQVTQSIQTENRIENEAPKTNKTKDCDKNKAKPISQKPSKIKRLRKLLDKTPLNYKKSNILTRSMSKNIPVDTNKKQSPVKTNPELDLFGSFSDSSSNSDNESLQTKINKIKNNNNNNIKDKIAEKIKINSPVKIKINSPVKISRKLEITPEKNQVFKRPERLEKRQTIPIGPLSPEAVNNCEIVQPKIIPLEQISNSSETTNTTNTNSTIEEHLPETSKVITNIISSSVINLKPIKTQNNNNNDKNVASTSKKPNKNQLQEKKFATKMICDIATMDWDKNLMNTVVSYLVNQDTLQVAKLIVNEAAIDRSQELDKSFTPPAPLLTPSQQKLLVLINRLDVEGLPGLKKKVIILAEKRILSEKYLTNILGLTRIYVSLCKLQYDIEGVRMFCCNAAYYLGDLFLPIMFIVLTMWGDVLPMAKADVPLAVTLVQVIQSKTCRTPGYNTNTLNRLLSDYYEYKRGKITNDQVMDKLVVCFIENPCNSIFTSILILCKNLTSEWRFKQTKKHLIPLVDKYRVDQSKSKLVSITLTLVNRIKDMFNLADDNEYINELNVWFANTNDTNNC